MSAGKYQYQPLRNKKDEFRVLHLPPLSKTQQEPLECRLSCVSLRAVKVLKLCEMLETLSLTYEAISYYWGNPIRSRVIIVNGKTLALPVNSEKALRRMLLQDQSRVVFLDAVCVNQDDLGERAAQVLLMGDIFRHAQATRVYLGDSVDSTAEAIINIRLLHSELQEYAQTRGGIREVLRGLRLTDTEPPLQHPINEEALIELFRRPWFRRVWVVQEVVLATECSLICGSEEVDMIPVLEVARWLCTSHSSKLSALLGHHLFPIFMIWNASVNPGCGMVLTMYNILNHGRYLRAADLRDRVFGMLGLLHEDAIGSELLAPDYTKSVSEVFRDAVRHSITDENHVMKLEILSDISHHKGSDLVAGEFPSWVPRFDRPSVDGSLEPLRLGSIKGASSLGDDDVNMLAASESDHEPDILVLLGTSLCSVEAVSAVFGWCDRLNDLEIQSEVFTWCEGGATMSQNYGIPEAAIARTMVADNFVGSLKPSKEPPTIITALLQRARYQADVPLNRETNSDADTLTAQAGRFYSSVQAWCRNRRIAIMSNGTPGLVPRLTMPSDLVVMMHGGSKPLVLRPHGEYFLMLGECYVDGWMPWQEHGDELHQTMMETKPTTYRIR